MAGGETNSRWHPHQKMKFKLQHRCKVTSPCKIHAGTPSHARSPTQFVREVSLFIFSSTQKQCETSHFAMANGPLKQQK